MRGMVAGMAVTPRANLWSVRTMRMVLHNPSHARQQQSTKHKPLGAKKHSAVKSALDGSRSRRR